MAQSLLSRPAKYRSSIPAPSTVACTQESLVRTASVLIVILKPEDPASITSLILRRRRSSSVLSSWPPTLQPAALGRCEASGSKTLTCVSEKSPRFVRISGSSIRLTFQILQPANVPRPGLGHHEPCEFRSREHSTDPREPQHRLALDSVRPASQFLTVILKSESVPVRRVTGTLRGIGGTLSAPRRRCARLT